MISLEQYAIAKDRCCLGYFGPDVSILRELVAARPTIEQLLPGIKVYISCRADFIKKLSTHMMIPSNELKAHRHDFAYFAEIRSDGFRSPVQQILDGIRSVKIPVQKLDRVRR
jgi:hypothetical protein